MSDTFSSAYDPLLNPRISWRVQPTVSNLIHQGYLSAWLSPGRIKALWEDFYFNTHLTRSSSLICSEFFFMKSVLFLLIGPHLSTLPRILHKSERRKNVRKDKCVIYEHSEHASQSQRATQRVLITATAETGQQSSTSV